MRSSDVLRAELQSDDDEVRRLAVIAIGEAADPELRDALLAGLGDDSWRVREESVRVAAELASPFRLLPDLIGAVCQGDNVGLRNAAISVLGAIGEPAGDALVAALPEADASATKFLIEALGDVGGEAATAALIERLDSDDPNDVAASLEALAHAGGPGAEAALRTRLAVPDPFVRMAALDALNRLEVKLPWDTLASLLGDSFLRGVLVPALGRCADARAVEYLIGTLRRTPQRPPPAVCEAVLHLCEDNHEAIPEVRRTLGQLDPQLSDSLAALAEGGDPPASSGAVLLLCLGRDGIGLRGLLSVATEGELGEVLHEALRAWGEPVIDLLFEHAARRDAARAATALALASELAARQWPEQDPSANPARARVRAELRAALGSPDLDLRVAAARTLSEWAEATDAPSLVDAAAAGGEVLLAACRRGLLSLSERAPDAVRDALRGVPLDSEMGVAFTDLIVALEGRAALPRLRDVLLSAEASARCAAVVGLSVLGGTEASELIALSLTDESWEVQLSAAEGLGRVVDDDGKPLGVEALLLALDGSPAELQAAVARALGVTGSERAVGPLRRLLERAGPRVRVAALEALSELAAPDIEDLLLGALSHDDTELVKHALSRVSLDRAEGRDAAIGLLDHARWDVRQLAVRLLADRDETSVRQALAARSEVEQDDLVLRALDRAMGLDSTRPDGGWGV